MGEAITVMLSLQKEPASRGEAGKGAHSGEPVAWPGW